MAETSYTHLRENLAGVLDKVVDDREVVRRPPQGRAGMSALLPADELAGLMETAHLLRSPANARRLMSALRGKGKRMSMADLRREVGLGPALNGRGFQASSSSEDLRYWVKTDRSVACGLSNLSIPFCEDPFQGVGKPEPLKYSIAGCWSRRITQEHRLVYKVSGESNRVPSGALSLLSRQPPHRRFDSAAVTPIAISAPAKAMNMSL